MKLRTPKSMDSRRKWRLAGVSVAALLLLIAALALTLRFSGPVFDGPALTTLIVQGELHQVSPLAVRAAVLSVVSGKGFFNVDMRRAQAAAQSLPWVATVTVRRGWPHTLYISLVEEVPVARWNGDSLMDAQGKVFVHGDVSAYAALPALSGPDGGAQDVLADYNSFVALTGPRGLGIAQLTVDARGAASVRLSDGIEVRLGREAAQQRLARFGAVALPALGAQLSSVAYVDMRYTNGFAVGWKTATVSGSVKRGEVRPDV
ncbi:MAG TPA: cell division protein FtsQ/DivIB [Gammaproteobacteria bacterium]|nr:cell division protein FtsQ/DivIB [Gammaproteobacteria bacterium]